MKFNLLAGVFAALLTTSTRAHPPGPETLQLKLSLDVVELAKDPTYAYLFFEGAELCPKNESYPVPVEVNCVPFKIDEPEIKVTRVTLHGYANCTLDTDSSKEYSITNFGLLVVTEEIDPPAVFVGGVCCYPKQGLDVINISH